MKKEKIDKNAAALTEDKPSKKKPEAYEESAIPLFLCLVCMGITLTAVLINTFAVDFGKELLAPVILELVAIVLPCYLMLLTLYPKKTAKEQFGAVGFRTVGVRYIFFILFSALFMMSASMVVSVLFGGVYSAAEGVTLLGTFTAGENDYTVAIPYLILAYALIPAVAEEFLLRGMVFSQLGGLGFAAAAVISAVLSGLMSFSLGGFIPAMFAAIMSCFVLYTTGSLWACMIVRFAFNVYRLFLEVNMSAYYISSSSRGLILVVIFGAFIVCGVLFFGESAKIYREKAEKVASGENEASSLCFKTFVSDIKKTVSYRPTDIMAIACALIFCAVALINYLT